MIHGKLNGVHGFETNTRGIEYLLAISGQLRRWALVFVAITRRNRDDSL